VLEAESLELRVEKAAIEANLDKTIDDTLMLGQSFDQAIRQAHLLYNGPPPSGDFDPNLDVFEDRMVPCEEMRALTRAVWEAPTEGAEDEYED